MLQNQAHSQQLQIGKILLRKPSLCHESQLFSQRCKVLRSITDHHQGLLHRTSRHIRRLIHKFGGIDLPRTRYTEERSGRPGRGGLVAERKVRVVLDGAARSNVSAHPMYHSQNRQSRTSAHRRTAP